MTHHCYVSCHRCRKLVCVTHEVFRSYPAGFLLCGHCTPERLLHTRMLFYLPCEQCTRSAMSIRRMRQVSSLDDGRLIHMLRVLRRHHLVKHLPYNEIVRGMEALA